MVIDGGAEAYLLLTKTDLVDPAVLSGQISEIRSAGIAAWKHHTATQALTPLADNLFRS